MADIDWKNTEIEWDDNKDSIRLLANNRTGRKAFKGYDAAWFNKTSLTFNPMVTNNLRKSGYLYALPSWNKDSLTFFGSQSYLEERLLQISWDRQ